MKPPTALEKFAGHPVTEAAATLLAASIGTPLAALVPVLSKSLAAERQRQRVEEAFQDINRTLKEHEEQLLNISDHQYKLLNEVVLALFETTEPEKLEYLRACIRGTLLLSDIRSQEAVFLSRVVRDISAEEAQFLINNFSYHGVLFYAPEQGQQFDDNYLRVDPKSPEALIVAGLVSLGLLVTDYATVDALNMMSFSSAVAKLIVLLRGNG